LAHHHNIHKIVVFRHQCHEYLGLGAAMKTLVTNDLNCKVTLTIGNSDHVIFRDQSS